MAKLDVSKILVPAPDHQEVDVVKSVAPQLSKLAQIEERLNDAFVGLRGEVRLMIMAVLTGEHLLFLSRSGTGKSKLVNGFLSQMGGSRFSKKCSIKDTDSRYFGPINSIQYAQKGAYRRDGENFIQKADWAFLDELFDAPDDILRTLLGILNERVYEEVDGSRVEAPLKSAFAAANYLRVNEVTEAVTDRFLFVSLPVDELSPSQQLEVDLNTREGKFAFDLYTELSLEEINGLKTARANVEVPADVLYLKALLLQSIVERSKLHTPGSPAQLRLSTRRKVLMTKVLGANALLGGRGEVSAEDLSSLRSCLGVESFDKFDDAIRGTNGSFLDPRKEAQLKLIGAVIDGKGVKRAEAEALRELIGIDVRMPKNVTDERDIARWMVGNLTPANSILAEFREVYQRRNKSS